MDSRSRFPLQIGDHQATVMTKYQCPTIDAALTDRDLVVRFGDFTQEVWNGKEFETLLPLPQFAVRVPAQLLLCFANPRYHRASKPDIDDEFDPEAHYFPPSVAQPDGDGTAQPLVVFRTAASE